MDDFLAADNLWFVVRFPWLLADNIGGVLMISGDGSYRIVISRPVVVFRLSSMPAHWIVSRLTYLAPPRWIIKAARKLLAP